MFSTVLQDVVPGTEMTEFTEARNDGFVNAAFDSTDFDVLNEIAAEESRVRPQVVRGEEVDTPIVRFIKYIDNEEEERKVAEMTDNAVEK